MKKKNFLHRTLLNISLPLFFGLSGGCGVEAGNPDSKGGKLFRIFVSPSSFPDTGEVSASIERVNLIQSDSVVAKNYRGQKLELASSNIRANEDSALALSIERDDSQISVQRVEVILSSGNPYLQVTLASNAEPVKAAIVDESGVFKRSLMFDAKTNSGSESDILIDVELRKSLKAVTPEQSVQLNLPNDVRFIIQQKHSFQDLSAAGSVSFANFEPGSLVCVFVGSDLPLASSDACTGTGFKSQIVSVQGLATIGSLAPGEYRAVNITRDNRVVELKGTTVLAGKNVLLTGN